MDFLSFSSVPALVKNPFTKDNISSISIWMSPNVWDSSKGWEFEATVRFKNGDTKGEQKITGKDFEELCVKLSEFCTSL